jgi:DNA invertase Pin-like site-specific DNA recombinase
MLNGPAVALRTRVNLEKRKQFAALFEDAAKRKFDCVLFWALDRFSREGRAQTIIRHRDGTQHADP